MISRNNMSYDNTVSFSTFDDPKDRIRLAQDDINYTINIHELRFKENRTKIDNLNKRIDDIEQTYIDKCNMLNTKIEFLNWYVCLTWYKKLYYRFICRLTLDQIQEIWNKDLN